MRRVVAVADRNAELAQVRAQRSLLFRAAPPADVAAGYGRAVVAQQGGQGALAVTEDAGQMRGGELGG